MISMKLTILIAIVAICAYFALRQSRPIKGKTIKFVASGWEPLADAFK